MLVPGSNLLAMASTLIASQTVGYAKYEGKTKTPQGVLIPTYAARVDVEGSFQPVSVDRVQRLGLDMSVEWATFYAYGFNAPLLRGTAPDRFYRGGGVWEVYGLADWASQDGWQAVLLQRTGNDDV